MAEIELKSLQFRKEREASWRDLETLVSRAESGGLGALTAQELARLPQLYRATLSGLSVARSISLDRALESFLEALCGRAYLVMYRPRRNFLQATRAFLLGGFPRAVREARRALLVATLIFFAGAAVGYFETRRDANNFSQFVDPGLAGERGPQASREELEEVLYGGDDEEKSGLALFAAFLFQNNARIGLASFALGGLAGVPVFFLMFNNGSMLGAFVAIHVDKGLGFELFGWLLPHGVTEILALLICAGAGLHIGHALVLPGRLKRRDALRWAGRRAGQIALGSVLLFFIAGLIEGIFRQKVQSDLIRYLVASATALFWFVYFVFLGEGAEVNRLARRHLLDSTGILSEVRRTVEIATPEGVVLEFEIASMGQRASALFVDLLLVLFVNVVLVAGLGATFGAAGFALGLVLWFLIINFYFPFCEYRWGATLGKRASGIRVIDRRGAPLTLEAILARNLMRDLEFWLPVVIFIQGDFLGALPSWAAPLSFFWVLTMMLLPLFNRQRLRLGDFAGGTIVVEAPRTQLLRDLAQKGRSATSAVTFSPAQLAVYGRVELQVLEDLLRRPQRESHDVVGRVAAKVRKRIGWSDEGRVIDNRRFLELFYRAQREELERLLVLGRARESKEDGRSPS